MSYYHNMVDSMFSTYPALGSYINRAGRVADIGEDAIYDLFDEEPRADLPTLTDARLGMLAKQHGHGIDDEGVLEYIESIVDDPKFAAYTEAYAKEGKNSIAEYRYTVEMSMGMETAFDKIYDTRTRDKAGGSVTLATPIESAPPVVEPPKTPVHVPVEPVHVEPIEPVEPVHVELVEPVKPKTLSDYVVNAPEGKPKAAPKPKPKPKTLSDYVVDTPVHHAGPIFEPVEPVEPSEKAIPKRSGFVATVKETAQRAGTMVKGFINRFFGRG